MIWSELSYNKVNLEDSFASEYEEDNIYEIDDEEQYKGED